MPKYETYIKIFITSGIALILAVGRFFDDRLSIAGINISVLISAFYILSVLTAFTYYQKLNIKKIYWYFIVFSLFIVLSFINSYFFKDLLIIDNYNITKLVEFIFITFLISTLIFLTEDFNLIKYLSYALFALAFMLLLSGLFAAIKNGFSFNDSDRLAVLGGGPIVYARWIITGALFFLFFIKISWIIKSLYLLLVLFLAVQSGSKGPIIAFFIAVTVTFFLSFLKTRKLSFILKTFFLIGIISASLFYFIKNSNSMPSRIKQLVQPEALQNSTSYTDRQERYQLSFEILKEQPLGIGLSNWSHYYNQKCKTKVAFTDYPHNIFLEIGIESGWAALSVFLLIMILVIYRSWKFYFKTIIIVSDNIVRTYNFLFSLFIFALFNTNLSGDLSDDRLLFVIMACMLVLTESNVIKKHQTAPAIIKQ
jgi:O-antigen ligase